MSLTCLRCLEGQHRRCERLRDCPCNICKVKRPRLKPRKRYKQVRERVPYDQRQVGGTKPWTEKEKDQIAEDILKLYQGFAKAGHFTPKPPPPVKDHVGATSKEEGDEICRAVMKLLENIKRKQLENANP